MKIAVITPYHREPIDIVLRCHRSVASQSYPCAHFLVADGFPHDGLDALPVRHIRLSSEHRDNGNTPRAAGGICAIAEGFDLLAYLDADNWYDSDHIESIAEAAVRTGAGVVCAPRRIWLADGRLCPFEDEDLVRRSTADTSSIALAGPGLQLAPIWGLIPPALSPICDRVMVAAINALDFDVTWTRRATVNYESRWPAHYAALGSPPPEDAHHTDWDQIERGYGTDAMAERLGFDPFDGAGPHRSTHKPVGLTAVET